MTHDPAQQRLPALEDEALMALTARQDKEAFTTLVRRHQNGLMNFFRRMGDYSSAEDLAQETFVRLFKYRKKYRPTAKFTTFLYVLARRTWIDHCRAAGRRRNAYEKVAEEAEVRSASGSASLGEAKARVSAALDELTDEMRTVVVMSIYQGFKYREIAEVLGIPLGTVKTRMFHALRKLREALTDEKES
jgi:RNA polymerase sigma-70 factor (ECF subfamily)